MLRSRLLGATARNAPASVSVLWRHVGRSGAKAGSVVLRAAPGRSRRLLTGAGVRRHRPDLAALALHAGGDRETAQDVLADAVRSRGPHLGGVAMAALTLDETDLARGAIELLPRDAPARARLEALLLAGEGRLDAALQRLQGARGARAGVLRRRLTGEVEVVRHELLTDSLTVPGPSPTVAGRPVHRVLHVVSNALPDVPAGYTIRTHGIVTAQRAAGLDPHVVTRLGFPVDIGVLGATRRVLVDGVPHHRLLPAGRLPAPGRAHQERWVADLRALMHAIQPDLLHAHSVHANAQAALVVGRAEGLPVVYEVRGFLEETWRSRGEERRADSDFYRWSREAETACMAAADAVVTLAATMRAEIVSRGVDPAKVHVVPNAVGPAFTAPLPPRGAARRAVGLPQDATVFGTVTTLNAYEGVDTLVAAVSLLDDPHVRLLVVGGGPEEHRLRRLAEPLGERVVFAGRVPHAAVRQHLAALDVFCVPRRVTPATVLVPPLKSLEAMAGGRPVLASDLPPLVEQVQPGRFGAVARPDDPVAWAEAMSLLGYAPDDLRTMGERARAWIGEHRTWARAVGRYGEVYAHAVGIGPHPPTDTRGERERGC